MRRLIVLSLAILFFTAALALAKGISNVTALGKEAGRLRQLSYKPIPSKEVSQKEASDYVLRLLQEELKGREIDVREAMVKGLGLMPAGQSSRSIYRKLYSSQVRGLYDPSKKQYIVVKGGGAGGSSSQIEQLGASIGLDITAMYTVHELGHAIQDQHFNLSAISKRVAKNFDQSFAAQSLIEGDASLLMMDYALGQLGMSRGQIGGAGAMGMDPGLLGMQDPAMAAAPAFFRESLTQPYVQGMAFAEAVRNNGGWKAVDRAFKSLPTTSEQIFHPEKYLKRENPKKVNLGGIPRSIGGYKLLGYDRAGEFTVRILEQETLGSAGNASAGWGGDRFWSYQKGRDTFVVWRTTWDSAKDAQEFASLLRSSLARRGKAGGEGRWVSGDSVYSFSLKGKDVDVLLGVPASLEKKF